MTQKKQTHKNYTKQSLKYERQVIIETTDEEENNIFSCFAHFHLDVSTKQRTVGLLQHKV